MTNSPQYKSEVAQYVLAHETPPLIKKAILEDDHFCEEFRISIDGVATFNSVGVSVRRSKLFEAIRMVLSGAPEVEIIDTEDQKWKLSSQSKEENILILVISRGTQCFPLPDFTILSPDSSTRLAALEDAATDVNLPVSAREKWHSILFDRALTDDEVTEYYNEFHNTPVSMIRSLCSEIKRGGGSISSLVPHSRQYFERLVGGYDGSASIKEYAAGRVRQLFKQLSEWRPYDGFLFSLFMASHIALTDEIIVEHLKREDLIHAIDLLEKCGDRISQLGAIEVGFRVLPEIPEIEPSIVRLVEQIRDDDVDGATSGFKLLSALFFLVDGELSRIRLFSGAPPFYRRLASLSQATLICRQFVSLGIEIDPICEWAINTRGKQYYVQSLADMRIEPYWYPDFAAASQMKADFFGRIMIAAKRYEKNINSGELKNIVLDTEPGSLHSNSQLFSPFFPGPLEGAGDNPNVLPAELSEAIEKQLGAEEVGPSSFVALVNSALIFRISSGEAELAAKALKLGSYRLTDIGERSQLITILNGLATVAAATRSRVLADELRIIVRRYRADPQYALSIEEVMRICLVAAASCTDLDDWRDFSGNWITELAFGDLDGNDGETLHSYLRLLCHSVPELWRTCGRADAALIAYNASLLNR